MSELTALTLAQARDGLKKKSFSAVELAQAHLAAIEKARALNAFVLETAEIAADMAKASDVRIAKGEAKPLDGIPIAVKDMFATRDVRTTACSHILDNFVPTYESTVTANLWRDGAVLLGKTNNDEFAMGSSNETSFFGPVISQFVGGTLVVRIHNRKFDYEEGEEVVDAVYKSAPEGRKIDSPDGNPGRPTAAPPATRPGLSRPGRAGLYCTSDPTIVSGAGVLQPVMSP